MTSLDVRCASLGRDLFLHVVFTLHVPVHGVALATRVLTQPAAHRLLVRVQHRVNLQVLQLPEHLQHVVVLNVK